jgi:hypothetical protein
MGGSDDVGSVASQIAKWRELSGHNNRQYW